MYAELGILFAKYKSEKLMDSIKMNFAKLNFPKLINAGERHYLWQKAVFLHMCYVECNSAANTMMQHSPSALMHGQFQSIM